MRVQTMLAAMVFAATVGCGSSAPPRSDDLENICGDGPVNLQTSIKHCGVCNRECTAVHATPVCDGGECSRGPCESGWVDLDPRQPGCESVMSPTNPPEAGIVFWTFAAGGIYGARPSSTSYQNEGALGEATPAPGGGAVEQRSAHYRNVTGFNAIAH